jgi:hypothetical protein
MRSAILHGAAAVGTFALVLTSAPDAGAATVLTTAIAFVNAGQIPAVPITNIDKKPITVTVQLFDANGTPETPNSNSCPVPPATLAPGTTCLVTGLVNTDAYAVVTTSSAKVRAALDVFDAMTGAFQVHIPATK